MAAVAPLPNNGTTVKLEPAAVDVAPVAAAAIPAPIPAVVAVPQVIPPVVAQPVQTFNGSARNPADENCKIFVGGVGRNTTEMTLRAYFSKFGEIADSVLMADRETGEPRGFAFVTFKSPDAVLAVIEQCSSTGHTLDGKQIDPKPAVPQGPSQQTKLNQQKVQQMQTQGHMYTGPMQVFNY